MVAMKLLIAIPALNEEDSIESIIQRSLAARDRICAGSAVRDVEITVVSDGSTDRTVELARKYEGQIKLIVFHKNRGYGAAIQEAWHNSDAELLGFLDADGTCDPNFFRALCDVLFREKADVALGCRLNRESRMPLIRRVGNSLFAGLLSALSTKWVRDTASGMRVVRRSALRNLLPLPNGMHFTPAMSAKAILSEDVKIAEIDMPYNEREGESKLRVVKDGLRFLRVILEAAFLFRPSRPLIMLAAFFAAVAGLVMVSPTVHYIRTRTVAEWMIYRFIVSEILGLVSVMLFCAAHLSRKMVWISLKGDAAPTPAQSRPFLEGLVFGRLFWAWPLVLFGLAAYLVVSSFVEFVRSGHVFEHWSRFVVMSFFFVSACALIITRLVDTVLGLLESHLSYLRSQRVVS
jgi:glycosyltransferase involved in cell wall biosynthesis